MCCLQDASAPAIPYFVFTQQPQCPPAVEQPTSSPCMQVANIPATGNPFAALLGPAQADEMSIATVAHCEVPEWWEDDFEDDATISTVTAADREAPECWEDDDVDDATISTVTVADREAPECWEDDIVDDTTISTAVEHEAPEPAWRPDADTSAAALKPLPSSAPEAAPDPPSEQATSFAEAAGTTAAASDAPSSVLSQHAPDMLPLGIETAATVGPSTAAWPLRPPSPHRSGIKAARWGHPGVCRARTVSCRGEITGAVPSSDAEPLMPGNEAAPAEPVPAEPVGEAHALGAASCGGEHSAHSGGRVCASGRGLAAVVRRFRRALRAGRSRRGAAADAPP